ncbi:hypothetical protein B2G71_12650 [Novosphingobium sp. PC22D]|uniref:alginate export family protein n=1 Tax=Novosphingobium sp. PC22D TaxID=1962403 RepID=UPI000BF0CFF1|nr:alginate export family protein [Novosphingobium sp. PC22D]PEQ12339.1 hypothetical protein B2G71_12650 [Novosphingobium sp. PC22D]
MNSNLIRALAASTIATAAALAAPAAAAKAGDPVAIGDGVTLDPIIDGLLRYEHVAQDNALKDADALTLRIRAGVELKAGAFALLAEANGNLALVDNYNDTVPGNGVEPYSVVADPDDVDLNRLQVQYTSKPATVTLGRQRINLDDQRFVGAVGWRQNEQTFDAVRGEFKVGPVALDATYALAQNTVFGFESPNKRFKGDFVFLDGGLDVKIAKVKAFAYLLDYDDRAAFSSQTYGLLASGSLPLGDAFKVSFLASYAHQSDYQANPVDYSADYLHGEFGASVAGFGLTAGYEELGSDGGVAAFQTPLATLHKFNGFADLFLTTPATGLRDYYGGIGKGLGDVGPLKGLKAGVTYHEFDSDFGGIDYGSEWDAVLSFKVGNYAVLLKYANYDAKDFAVDTEKFWLQFGFSY